MASVIKSCGSPSSQIEMLKKFRKSPLLEDTLKLIDKISQWSESSEQHSPTLSNIYNVIK